MASPFVAEEHEIPIKKSKPGSGSGRNYFLDIEGAISKEDSMRGLLKEGGFVALFPKI